jgi:hypothetical protein
LMLQLQLWATASKKKARTPFGQLSGEQSPLSPVSSPSKGDAGDHMLPEEGSNGQTSPNGGSPKKLNLEKLGLQSWIDLFPPGGLDFQKSLMRVVQFELGPDSVLYAERMKEQERQLRKVRSLALLIASDNFRHPARATDI